MRVQYEVKRPLVANRARCVAIFSTPSRSVCHDAHHSPDSLTRWLGMPARSATGMRNALAMATATLSPVAANRYLHTVDGRDAEIAAARSELAEQGDAARLPKSINVKH